MDSNYYSNLMKQYEKEINIYVEKIKKHTDLVSILKNIVIKMNKSKDYLSNSEKLFLNGGYINGDVSFDNGENNKNIDDIEKIIENIQNIITKTMYVIEDLNRKEKIAKVNYDNAKSNYYKCVNKT